MGRVEKDQQFKRASVKQAAVPPNLEFLVPEILLLLLLSAPAAPAQRTPRLRSRKFPVLEFHSAIDDDVAHAFGKLVRLCVRGLVHDCCGVEDGDVGEVAGSQKPALPGMLALRRHGSNPADSFLRRPPWPVAGGVTRG